MRWSSGTKRFSRSTRRTIFWPALVVLVTLASTLLLSGSPEEKRISVYSNVANYSLTVIERGGTDYVGLLEILEPLGTVSARTSGLRWRLRYNDMESEFTPGSLHARVQGSDLDLPGNFLLENGRGLVPISSLSKLLPRILGGPVTFHDSARRLFIGNIAVHFTAQVSKTIPPRLVMEFTSPVNPMIATEPGRLRMVFTHEALMAPGSQILTFDSKTIPSAIYQENNGAAEVIVTGSVPLLASFSNDGRTITIAPPSPGPPSSSPPLQALKSALPPATQLAPIPAASGNPSGPIATAPPARPLLPRQYFVVVDASHGGEERGAALSDQLAEKDVTLAFARSLRQELEARGLSTLLLRDGDTTLTLDQRASMTNAARPAIYIGLHAASQGPGLRLYTALVPVVGDSRGPFLDWNTAQASFRFLSQTAETSMAAELRSKHFAVRTLAAPLRPLNNLTMAALAIEVTPPAGDISQLSAPAYQQSIAGSIASGIAGIRERLEVGR